jgi:putative FmdB family regulatory protein
MSSLIAGQARRDNPHMPLYDFRCRACETRFEARVGLDQAASCPVCGARGAERLLSPFAGPFTVGLRGAAARRSNAQRRAREERRQERRQERRRRRREEGSR